MVLVLEKLLLAGFMLLVGLAVYVVFELLVLSSVVAPAGSLWIIFVQLRVLLSVEESWHFLCKYGPWLLLRWRDECACAA